RSVGGAPAGPAAAGGPAEAEEEAAGEQAGEDRDRDAAGALVAAFGAFGLGGAGRFVLLGPWRFGRRRAEAAGAFRGFARGQPRGSRGGSARPDRLPTAAGVAA